MLMQIRRGARTVVLFAAVAAALATAVRPASAHETDPFTLPENAEFADLGAYFTLAHYRVLERIVDKTNAEIRRVRDMYDEEQRDIALKRLQSPNILAHGVRNAFGVGFVEQVVMEEALRVDRVKEIFPEGKIVAHRPRDWIYLYTHLPIDPRRLPLILQASMIRVYGVYMGTDKWAHFHDLGHIYWINYQRQLAKGRGEEEAVRNVVHTFAKGPVSETMLIGRLATGVISNADLAANYLGFKFFCNLTEPVTLGGEEHPPLIIRVGDFWRLNFHVRPDSDFMKPFISDHLNEALNPCDYEWGMRPIIAWRIREHADNILALYACEEGEPRPREWFEAKFEELVTYYGEDYGHTGLRDSMVTIATCCFPEEAEEGRGGEVSAVAAAPDPDDARDGRLAAAGEGAADDGDQ